MKTSKLSCSCRRARSGLTLVEVVAGLALMATLLVSMLVLKARFVHDLADAAAQQRGIAAADAIMTNWWADPSSIPTAGGGGIKDSAGLSWRTSVVANPAVNRLRAKVVRLDIADDHRITASVQFLLPVEARREE